MAVANTYEDHTTPDRCHTIKWCLMQGNAEPNVTLPALANQVTPTRDLDQLTHTFDPTLMRSSATHSHIVLCSHILFLCSLCSLVLPYPLFAA